MLTISSPDLPTTANNPTAGAAIANLSDSTNGGALLAESIAFSSGLEIETTETESIPPYSGNEISVTVPSTASNVSSIVIDGITYNPTQDPEGTPSAGEFSFNEATNTATINVGSQSPTEGTAIQYQSLAQSYTAKTDRWTGAIPRFLRQWNISGEISLTRSFEGPPSGSIQFLASSSDENSIRTTLRIGTKVVLFNRGYAIADLQIEDTGERYITVQVGLQGAHDIGLDAVAVLRETSSTATVSLNTLAQRSGLQYKGPDIQVPIDREASLKATTTLGTELERSRSVGGFAYYSHPEEVQIREWGKTKIHVLSKADVMSGTDSPIRKTFSGSGNIWKSHQMAEEYLNRELLLDRVDTVANSDENGRTNTVSTIVSGNRGITSASLPLDLREPNNSFDLGGKTIERTTTQYKNGLETWIETDEFGYAYALSQVYVTSVQVDVESSFTTSFTATPTYSETLAQGRFMKVRSKLTRTFFSDNYLIKRTTRIRELKRYKSDTNQKESIALSGAIATGQATFANQQLLNLYQDFFWTERIDTEEWTLEEFARRYPDVDTSQFDYKPKFAISKRRRDLVLESIPNPETIAFANDPRTPGELVVFVEAPALVTGSDFRESEDTSIIYPELGIAKSRYRQEKDAFKTDRRTENLDGAELQRSLTIANTTESLGRPSEHIRLQEYEETGDVRGNEPPDSNVQYLMRSPNTGLTDDDPIEGSISFLGADTLAKATLAAETDLSIQNTQNIEVWDLLLVPTRRYDEGDLIQWRNRTFVILSISENFFVEDVRQMSVAPWQITMGRFMKPPVEVSEVDANA